MDGLNGPDLFESMYADDTEGKKLKEMPGVDELVTTYPLYAYTNAFSFLNLNFHVKKIQNILKISRLMLSIDFLCIHSRLSAKG